MLRTKINFASKSRKSNATAFCSQAIYISKPCDLPKCCLLPKTAPKPYMEKIIIPEPHPPKDLEDVLPVYVI